MTTKEYVLKYTLNVNDRFDRQLFVEDLASDLIALLETNKAKDNIKGFDNAVRCVRMKFDAINNKTVGEIQESVWKFFWATVVVKLREVMCPEDMNKRREAAEFRKKQWEMHKERERQEQEMFDDFWNQSFNRMLFGARKVVQPVYAYTALNLPLDADVEAIKSAFRELSKIHHPDRGGKQEVFIGITEAKNKCLEWLNR